MHILHSPVFLATNSTGAPHGDELSRINPRFNKSSTCLACSRSSCAESGYAFRFTGFSLPVSITWSIQRSQFDRDPNQSTDRSKKRSIDWPIEALVNQSTVFEP